MVGSKKALQFNPYRALRRDDDEIFSIVFHHARGKTIERLPEVRQVAPLKLFLGMSRSLLNG